MINIDLPIWNKCNNECLMCTNTDSMRDADVFQLSTIKNYLEEKIKKAGGNPQTIHITGGEPTIAPHFFKVLRYIRKNHPRIKVKVLSNGRRFVYDEFTEKCLQFPIDFIIPIHGSNPELHDNVTRVSGSFSQTFRGLKKIIRKRKVQDIEIRIIATQLNFQDIPNILKLIKQEFEQVEKIAIIFLELEGQGEKNIDDVKINYEELKPILQKAKEYFEFFDDLRLYHFPLCMLEKQFWPYAWRTLPDNEVVFLDECKSCKVKKYCLGVHKSYLEQNKKPEISSITELNVKIEPTGNFHKPIKEIKNDPSDK